MLKEKVQKYCKVFYEQRSYLENRKLNSFFKKRKEKDMKRYLDSTFSIDNFIYFLDQGRKLFLENSEEEGEQFIVIKEFHSNYFKTVPLVRDINVQLLQ